MPICDDKRKVKLKQIVEGLILAGTKEERDFLIDKIEEEYLAEVLSYLDYLERKRKSNG